MDLFSGVALFLFLSALLGYFNHRWLKLPVTIGLTFLSVIIGVGLKTLDLFFPETFGPIRLELSNFNFSSFLLDGVLCFLLFAGSLHVNLTSLKESRTTILSFATFGVLVSALLLGWLTQHLLALFGYESNFIICFLFGALISPTDPIAVIGIISKYSVPEKLKTVIVGESLFNDGVGVVLFAIIYTLFQNGIENFHMGELIRVFSIEVFGGISIGFVVGIIAYRLMKTIDHYQTEVMITLALVMGGSVVANYLHASGPLAMVIAGLIIGNKGKQHAMSDTTFEYVDKFWELIDEICNSILFILIGLEVFIIPFKTEYLLMMGIIIILALLVRFVSLAPMYFVLNKLSGKRFLDLTVLTWGGLRGGISIALALSIYKTIPNGELFLVLTYSIVIFSILVQGLSVKWLLKRY